MRCTTPTLILATMTASACYDPFSNEDLIFRRAVPDSNDVRFAVPADPSLEPEPMPGTMTSTVPPPGVAQFYWSGKQTSEVLNGIVTFVLGVVEEVFKYPPTVRESDRRVWGPFPDDHRAAEIVFTIEHVVTSTAWRATSTCTIAEVDDYFTYRLEARRFGSQDPFVVIFIGAYAAGGDIDSGIGFIFADLEAVRALNMDDQVHGFLFVGYDSRFGQQTTEIQLDTVIDPEHPFQHIDAGYRFHEEGGRKDFIFVYEQDIAELQPNTGPEQIIVFDRWLPDNRGRADAVVRGGDLGSLVFVATECWDAAFMQVYFFTSFPDQVSMNRGSVDLCAQDLRRAPWEE